MTIFFFACTVIIFLQTAAVSGDMVTALADMEGLVSTELQLVKHLENYIQEEETRLTRLKSFLEEYESIYQEASADPTSYLANPLNAYLLVKRLTSDWKKVKNVVSRNVGSDFVKNITQHKNDMRLPSDEDLNGAAVALLRLQDTYQLDTHSLAEGKMLGKKKSRQLTADDCWELGRQSYNNGDHYHTVLWMSEALSKSENESNKTVSRQDILGYLAFSTYKQGNVKEALHLTRELLKIVPFHQHALGNVRHYERLLREQESTHEQTAAIDDVTTGKRFNATNLKLAKNLATFGVPSDLWDNYEKLCRGEKIMDPKIEGRLRCRYVTNNVPFFFIQPVKLEEAFLKPLLVIYHDVIFDEEIETVKKIAQPRLKRTTVQNMETGESIPVKYRISKAAFLRDDEHHLISKVSRRVGYITGLDMTTAEELQVCNYGIGGHYVPHFDYAKKGEVHGPRDLEWGNRIATWLFYMSDVEAGGATVFPSLGVALWPRKGSAAFWYNLYPNGEGNENTRHAACPVLTGSKWVSNKWIHERNQELRRPCGLTYTSEM
ncbi:prolyl 4-hydroxylase subunit alpha-1-like [Daphnia carinata]|uniref:prolyl 4-hydroxylase subunit alpha-1-like n=1 Tax=Daphnia carinata TaxID=120202 RepID=UPI0028697156|nr:prolyl 4-hydroxylase subunit alpha-1-like [Daphnia carinata]